jgi:hypothetical protein
VAERPIEEMTLREMFTSAESLIRDVEDHLHNSFLPKSRATREKVRSNSVHSEQEFISDTTVRTHVAELLSSDDYSETLITRLNNYLAAIEVRSKQAISVKPSVKLS